MNRTKLLQHIDKIINEIQPKKIKGGCMTCMGKCKGGCMECGGICGKKKYESELDEYESDGSDYEYGSDNECKPKDKYNMDKVYNYGGSDRYSYRKKVYNRTVKTPRVQSEKNKKWMNHVAKVKKQHPKLEQRDVLALASKLYVK